jgi:Holliday junction DNA helicase RuvA
MYAYLSGKFMHSQPPRVVVDVNGVGFDLLVPMTTIYQLPAPGALITLYTHLVVREDEHTLYGFADEPTRALFRQLMKTNGVGPKLALTILSGMDNQTLIQTIVDKDDKKLTKLPGVGPKMAQRLVLELADKLSLWDIQTSAVALSAKSSVDGLSQAQEALMALGYKPQDIKRLLANIDDTLAVDQIIRQALARA